MKRRPPRSPLFPHTTLSRSDALVAAPGDRRDDPGDQARLDVAGHHPAQPPNPLRRQSPAAHRPFPPCHVVRPRRSEEHTSELQSRQYLVCRLLLEKKKKKTF